MAQGNEFSTGGNIVDGQDSQPFWTQTHEDERYPIGTLRVEPADETADAEHTDGTALGLKGDRTWMFVRAKEAVDIYDCCSIWTGGSGPESYMVQPAASTGMNALDIVGVAQTGVTDEYYFWILVQGECVVNGAAGITVGQFLDTNGGVSAGQVDDDTTAGNLIGRALSGTDTPVSGTVRARLIGLL